MGDLKSKISAVILSYNRCEELRRTLAHMSALPERPELIVVDNASTDATASMVRKDFPEVRLLISPRNIGGAARNLGVRAAATPYVAFCDDDSWWHAGSLHKAVQILDRHPRVAALCARILLGPDEREDPICKIMASSPLDSNGLPGKALLGFVACAAVLRRDAYLEAGGYEERFFVGGEEALLSLDLAVSGWSVVYIADLVAHHYPSPQRDRKDRHRIISRNAIWLAWLRLPLLTSLRETRRMLAYAMRHKVLLSTLRSALKEARWVIRNRKVVSPQVHAWYKLLNG
jgi:GT2 family glycosyltransferase